MRDIINLVEAVIADINDYSGGQTPLLINPSRRELLKLIHQTEHHDVRMFVNQNVYAWDSAIAHHDVPIEHLRPEDADCGSIKGAPGRRCVNISVDENGPYANAGHYEQDTEDGDPEASPQFKADAEFVENHPIMKRLFGQFTLRCEW